MKYNRERQTLKNSYGFKNGLIQGAREGLKEGLLRPTRAREEGFLCSVGRQTVHMRLYCVEGNTGWAVRFTVSHGHICQRYSNTIKPLFNYFFLSLSFGGQSQMRELVNFFFSCKGIYDLSEQ